MINEFPSEILSILIMLPSHQAYPYLDKLQYCCDHGLIENPHDVSPSEHMTVVEYFDGVDKLIKEKSK